MTGSLAAFQSDLGRALRGENTCPLDPNSAGYRFTMTVRRSWCEGRVIMAVRKVLTVIPTAERQRLIADYVDRGGGLEMFLEREGEAFLAFLVQRLPEPSHARTLCQMHQALIRARLGGSHFAALRRTGGPVCRGRYASLVWFYADPGAVVSALTGGELPPLGAPQHAMLFAPGLPDLFRTASEAEAALWASLPIADPMADAPTALIAPLLMAGVLEYSEAGGDAPVAAHIA